MAPIHQHSAQPLPRITTLDAEPGPTCLRPVHHGIQQVQKATDRPQSPPRFIRLRRPARSTTSPYDMLPVHHKLESPLRGPSLHLRTRTCFRLIMALTAAFAVVFYLSESPPRGFTLPFPGAPRPTPYGLDEELSWPEIHHPNVSLPPFEHIEPTPTTSIWPKRAEAVRSGFLHALKGYKAYSFPHDELLPLSHHYQDKCVCAPTSTVPCHSPIIYSFNGWGVTLIDSLDTMYLMGLHGEFNRSISHVAKINLNKVSKQRFLGAFG